MKIEYDRFPYFGTQETWDGLPVVDWNRHLNTLDMSMYKFESPNKKKYVLIKYQANWYIHKYSLLKKVRVGMPGDN